MRPLKVLSLLAALALLGGAVLDAQTGLVRQALTASPDAGKKLKANPANNSGNSDLYVPASKAGPLIRPRDLEPEPQPPPQQAQQAPSQAAPEPSRKDAGK